MKYSRWLLAVLLLNLLGCAQQISNLPPSASADHHAPVATNKPVCQSADMLCADTVTATFDNNGQLWVAWVNQDHIYVQHSADAGQHFSSAVQVNSQAEPVNAHGEYRPKIKLDANGNVFITWTVSLEKRHTGHIRFSRSTDGGNNFTAPVTINDNLDIISHRFDSLEIGQNGEVFIAWLDGREKEANKTAKPEFLGTSLYYTWSGNSGQQFYPNARVAAHTCECCRLGTALDANNLPVVIWRHVFPGQIRDHALSHFSDWNTPGAVTQIATDNWNIEACPHHGPSLAIAGDDSYHMVWFSGAATHQGLFYARSEDGGQHFSQPMAFGGQAAVHPYVASLGLQVAIVWTAFDGKENQVWLIQSHDNGNNWTAPQLLASTSAAADYAFLVKDQQALYLSWQTAQGYQFLALPQ